MESECRGSADRTAERGVHIGLETSADGCAERNYIGPLNRDINLRAGGWVYKSSGRIDENIDVTGCRSAGCETKAGTVHAATESKRCRRNCPDARNIR